MKNTSIKKYLARIGRRGGRAKSAAKSAAAAKNGLRGGRPRKPVVTVTVVDKRTGEEV